MRKVKLRSFVSIFAFSFLISLSLNEEAPQATVRETQPKPLIVAVIDTGADINHSMIKDYLWSNPGETGLDSQGRDKSSNGLDDDANGFIDDVHGWNFIDANNSLKDSHGHGTHISGIIAGELSPEAPVRLMILKYYDSEANEEETLKASNQAVRYALDMGASVINYSGGGDLPSSMERALFKEAEKERILVVAASGNDGRSTDYRGFYPASYGFENIISVASTDESGELLPSSNRGTISVDIAALGSEVLSSLPHQRLGKLTGTSQATAKVTGVLAAMMAHSPQSDFKETKKRLIRTAKFQPSLAGRIKNPKVPDLDRALKMRDQNEFNEKWKITMSRANEVFDDPLTVNVDRQISSERMEFNPKQEDVHKVLD